jgi:hypothetical protein
LSTSVEHVAHGQADLAGACGVVCADPN